MNTLSELTATETDASAPFYIAATASFQEGWPRILKHGDTFAMFDQHGDILNAAGNPAGIFHEDTRYLSGSYLLIEGHRPLLLSSTIHDDNTVLTVDLANPDILRGDDVVMSRETLHITRTKFIWKGACYERIAAQNFDSRAHETRLLLWFAADFADLFEVRGMHRPHRGTCNGERMGSDQVMFHYRGLDGLDRYTHLQYAPAPALLDQHHAAFDLKLEPGQRWSCVNAMRFGTSARIGGPKFITALRGTRRDLRARIGMAASVSSSNKFLNKVFRRSVTDLYMLTTETPEGPYPYAGIPWFSTAFGRDGIITALQMLWLDPRIARGVLRFLAAHQAKDFDELSEAEPGKILHEVRHGEMARLGEVPFQHYYGSVDCTPLFVLLAGKYFERTGDIQAISALWPHIEAALTWMDVYGDADQDGFVEYRQRTERGLNNQGWKDSKDCISHADGSLAEGAIALCEVQAYVFAAKRLAADLARSLGKDERARIVAQSLLLRDAFSGWGIRTLNTSERRYNPMSYHNGSVWPHDNALIAQGFAHYGFKDEVLKVFNALFAASQYVEMRLPELFCGFPRRTSISPTLYPVACAPQAWASGTPLMLLQASLGMTLDHARNEIRFERPLLPSSVDDIRLHNLEVGSSKIDLLLQRHGRDVVVDVLDRKGDVRVVTVS